MTDYQQLFSELVDVQQVPISNAVAVSVRFVTYNHARYIRESLDSILDQQVDFRYQIVAFDDCSTDGTREILLEYAQRYPGLFKLVLAKRNLCDVGPGNTMLAGACLYDYCDGKYIAMLEGDDYWTDPLKLQKQVDFFEVHPECSMCYHRVAKVRDTDSEPVGVLPDHTPNETASFWETYGQGFGIHTSSVLLRNECVRPLPAWFSQFAMGDWPLCFILGIHGKFGYVDEVMSVYRLHAGGIWSSSKKEKQIVECERALRFFRRVQPDVNGNCAGLLGPEARSIALGYYRVGGYLKAFWWSAKALGLDPRGVRISRRKTLFLLLISGSLTIKSVVGRMLRFVHWGHDR